MFTHNLWLAWKSLRRNPLLTLLIVSGVALGICISTMFSAARHSLAKDPIPAKSRVLHYVRLDSWDPARGYPTNGAPRPPTQITWRDAEAIAKSDIPVRQSPMYQTSLFVHPGASAGRPYRETVRVCASDFFAMFEVPFEYGSGWDRKADEAAESVLVIDGPTNQRLFGGANSVGRVVRLEERDFRVVGVLARWRPNVRFYDLTQNVFAAPEAMFIPYALTRPLQLRSSGNNDGWGPSVGTGFEGRLASESCWIQMWVELPSHEKVTAYQDFLRSYATEQKKIGRFQRPIDNRVTPVLAWMDEQGVVPKEATSLVVVSLLFLVVSALNLSGLLLGKFLARSAEIGVRRALGASRLDIFVQHIVECEVVGLVGGAVGLALSVVGLRTIGKLFPFGELFGLDPVMLVVAIGLSLLAGLIAGFYPAWRICATVPAVHLKLQ